MRYFDQSHPKPVRVSNVAVRRPVVTVSAAIAIAVSGLSALAVVEPESYSAPSRAAASPVGSAPVVTAVLTTSSLDGGRLTRETAPAIARVLRDVAGVADVTVSGDPSHDHRLAGSAPEAAADEPREEGQPRVLVVWNDLPGIGFDVHRAPEHRAGVVRDGVLEKIDSVRAGLPPGVHLDVVGGPSRGLSAAVTRLRYAMLLGIAISLVVVVLLVRSARSTAVVVATVSISAAGTIAAMRAVGINVDLSTVLGAAVALGLLIDDAIVVREAIVRRRELGAEWRAAIVRGVSDVGRGVATTIVVAVLALIPIALMDALARPWRDSFALPAVAAAIVSAIVSLALIPVLSGVRAANRRRDGGWLARQLARADCWFDGLTDRYHELLAWALDHRRATAVVAVVAIAVVTASPASRARLELWPSIDRGRIAVDVATPTDSSLWYTAARAQEVSDVARAHPEVESVYTTVGDWSGASNVATVHVGLISRSERTASPHELGRAMRSELGQVPGASYSLYTSGSARGKPIRLELRGADSRTLFGVAQRIADEVRLVPGAVDVATSSQSSRGDEGPAHVDHVEGDRVMRVEANVDGHALRDVETQIAERLASVPLPPGYSITDRGDVAETDRMSRRLIIAAGIAVALVFLVIGAHLASLVDALAVMLVLMLPLAAVTGVLTFTDRAFDSVSLVAAVVVCGVCAKQAVQLMDFSRHRRRQGATVRVGLVEAGRARLRPIVTASAAIVAVALPVAMSGGESAERYAPLGAAVIGGTLASVVTTLVVLPACCAILHDMREGGRRWLAELLATTGDRAL